MKMLITALIVLNMSKAAASLNDKHEESLVYQENQQVLNPFFEVSNVSPVFMSKSQADKVEVIFNDYQLGLMSGEEYVSSLIFDFNSPKTLTLPVLWGDIEAIREWASYQFNQGQTSFTLTFVDGQATIYQAQNFIEEALSSLYQVTVIDFYQVTVLEMPGQATQFQYNFSFASSREEDQEIEDFARRFAQGLSGLSEEEKVRSIHDKILSLASYDGGQNGEIDGISVHHPYSLLKNGRGVCQAYAGLFQKMCDEAGLQCRIVSGWPKDSQLQTDQVGHDWNEVYLNGEWVEIDVTWNDQISEMGGNSYTYYLRDLSADHIRDSKARYEREEVSQ